MNITMVQAVGHIDDPTANAFKIRMRVNNIDSDLFIFPEMVMCGYVKSKEKMHLKIVEGREMDMIKEFSTKKGCAIICGGPRSDGDNVYDSAYFINGNEVATYDKIHLDEGFVNEKDLFKSGKDPKIIEHKGMKFGLAVGHDVFFPELFRYYASNDVDMVICIAAVTEDKQKDHAKLIPARALENSMYVAYVNMVGVEPGVKMAGGSMLASPSGEILETFGDTSDVRTIRMDDDEIKNAKGSRIRSETKG